MGPQRPGKQKHADHEDARLVETAFVFRMSPFQEKTQEAEPLRPGAGAKAGAEAASSNSQDAPPRASTRASSHSRRRGGCATRTTSSTWHPDPASFARGTSRTTCASPRSSPSGSIRSASPESSGRQPGPRRTRPSPSPDARVQLRAFCQVSRLQPSRSRKERNALPRTPRDVGPANRGEPP